MTTHDESALTVIGHLYDLTPGTMKMVHVDGKRVCVVRTGDGVYALDQACPHEGYGLTTGVLDGDTITCAWHNWKFRVEDGKCVLGEEDVATHDVAIANDGTVAVRLRAPDPAIVRPQLEASLRSGIERNYVGQISRDVIRLLRADANPGELMWEAVAYGAPRAEFGWGHAIASLTDCLYITDHYTGDERALPIVQAIAGVAEVERGRPVQPLPEPTVLTDPLRRASSRADFRTAVEREDCAAAQALVRGAIAVGADRDELQLWFTDVVTDHLLSYGHAAIYVQKAFQLLDRLGWGRADTVLPYLVPTIVYGTREDTLPYMKLFLRGMSESNMDGLAEAAREPRAEWVDDGRLMTALLGPDRTEAARAAGAAIMSGAGLERVLNTVTAAVSERMLRYDTDGEFDFHDDFDWLDITHGITYANAVRWLIDGRQPDVDLVRLVMWSVFLANWTGRHEWHTRVAARVELAQRSDDLAVYGRLLQHEALLDGTTAFIVHAHAIKMSVASTEEALFLGSSLPLDATARFLTAPKQERRVAATVTRSIDFLSGRIQRD